MRLAGQQLVPRTSHHSVACLVHAGALLACFTASLAAKTARSNNGSSQAVSVNGVKWRRTRTRFPARPATDRREWDPLSIPCSPDHI